MAEVGLCDHAGMSIYMDCAHNATALLLCGAPIEEPIMGHGPFVMNTSSEIFCARCAESYAMTLPSAMIDVMGIHLRTPRPRQPLRHA